MPVAQVVIRLADMVSNHPFRSPISTRSTFSLATESR